MGNIDLNTLLSTLDNTAQGFTTADVVLTIMLSFGLSLVIGWTYRHTHHGSSYSQSFVQTLVIVSMVVGVVMLIIGSNIARAFTLVGALSIVRFRNAVKETRDVGFIFFTMAMGMACGTRFYVLAVVSTVVICFLIWLMSRQNMFENPVREQILKIRIPADTPYDRMFAAVFDRYLRRADLMGMESVQAGMLTELVYGVELKRSVDPQTLLNDLRELNQNNKVLLITGYHEVDL